MTSSYWIHEFIYQNPHECGFWFHEYIFTFPVTAIPVWSIFLLDECHFSVYFWFTTVDEKTTTPATKRPVFYHFQHTFNKYIKIISVYIFQAYILLEVLKFSYAPTGELWHGLVLVAAFLLADILQNTLFICVFSIAHIAGKRENEIRYIFSVVFTSEFKYGCMVW